MSETLTELSETMSTMSSTVTSLYEAIGGTSS
ncbi:hypothetical protein J2S22_003276 [Rhodoplanes tepidamans]|nr:hypothetical protein [Rhodoplanes tepidamans]